LVLQLKAGATPDAAPWNRKRHKRKAHADVRSSYEVDRDRIVHSATFRELQYKTQVQGLAGEHWPKIVRTRLNHVLEVAQIARGLAQKTGANEALAESISLAHDLGHAPFGHAGERALREALRSHGFEGWNANVHSLAVVDTVEEAFIDFRGLDLTWATREGIARHSTPFDEPATAGEFAETPNAGLECQIVDCADVFAYLSHDLDDAIAGSYISLNDVGAIAPLLQQLLDRGQDKWEKRQTMAWPESERDLLLRRWLIAHLINRLLADAAATTTTMSVQLEINSPEAVRAASARIVAPSTAYTDAIRHLLDTLTKRYYRSPDVAESDRTAIRMIRDLFEALVSNPGLIPVRFRTGEDPLNAATFIASLNDHEASQLAAQLDLA